MRSPILALVLMPALALTARGGGSGNAGSEAATPEVGTQADEEIELAYGDSIGVGSLDISFIAVVDDSRCAYVTGVNCVWEGDAHIQLSVSNGRLSDMLDLHTNST